jgi:hypothetical protein
MHDLYDGMVWCGEYAIQAFERARSVYPHKRIELVSVQPGDRYFCQGTDIGPDFPDRDESILAPCEEASALKRGWRLLTMGGKPWACWLPIEYPDMSDGAIVDRFYETCSEVNAGKSPLEYFQAYGGRKEFCRSIRKFTRIGSGISEVPGTVTRALCLPGENFTPSTIS